jgi:hypothetical protein
MPKPCDGAPKMALARIADLLAPGESDPELMAQLLAKVAKIASCEQCGGAGAYLANESVQIAASAKRCLECNPIPEHERMIG